MNFPVFLTFPFITITLTAIYFIAGKLGLALAFIQANATLVWPPTGIALTAFLLLGNRASLGIFLGAFFVNLTTAGTVGTSLGIAIGNTLEGLIGAYLITRWAQGIQAFSHFKNTIKFLVFAGMGSTMISATIGVTTLVLGGLAHWHHYPAIWFTWWLGDLSGCILIAPLLLSWLLPPSYRLQKEQYLELACLTGLTILIGGTVFWEWLFTPLKSYPLDFLCIPLIAWSAFRFRLRETTSLTTLLSAIAIGGTLSGLGPFAKTSANESLFLLQSFMATLISMALPLNAIISKQKTTKNELLQAKTILEARVQERTQALRATNTLLEEAQAVAHLGNWEWDIPSNHVRWSRELYALYGLNPETFTATYEGFLTHLHPDDRAMVEQHITHAFHTGQPFSFQHRIILPDGKTRWLYGRGNVFMNEAGKVIRMAGTAQDITEWKQMEEALASSSKAYQAVAETALDGILSTNAEGNIIYFNRAAQHIFGYLAEEVLGKHYTILMPERFHEAHLHGIQTFFTTGETNLVGKTTELIGRHQRGHELPLEVSTATWKSAGETYFTAIFRDISERKQAEQVRLQAALAEFSDDAIVGISLSGIITSWNSGAEKLYGYTPQQIVNNPIRILSPLDTPHDMDDLLAKIKTGNHIENHEVKHIKKQGQLIDVSLTLSPVKEADGHIVGASLVIRDITEHKKADRMREEFVGIASHELRTPLTTISGAIDYLSLDKGGHLTPKQRNMLATASRNVERLNKIVDNLLDLSRLESGHAQLHPQSVKIIPFIKELVQNFQEEAKRQKLRLTGTWEEPFPSLYADPDLLNQILRNLISNALRFAKTNISISATSYREQQQTYLRLSVSDDGPGIPKENFRSLFDKFVQMHRPQGGSGYKGTGLGLAISKEMALLHGGDIWVESELGKGATFCLKIPLHPIPSGHRPST